MVEDVTDKVHPHIKVMAENLAAITQIDNLGIDYITLDIAQSYEDVQGAVTEYNHLPHLGILAVLKDPDKVFQSILQDAFRIPVNLIIGCSSQLREYGKFLKEVCSDSVGWLCGETAYIGQQKLYLYDRQAWSGVNLLLRQKKLQSLIIVADLNQLQSLGLPVDRFNRVFVEDQDIPDHWKKVIVSVCDDFCEYESRESLITDLPAVVTS